MGTSRFVSLDECDRLTRLTDMEGAVRRKSSNSVAKLQEISRETLSNYAGSTPGGGASMT